MKRVTLRLMTFQSTMHSLRLKFIRAMSDATGSYGTEELISAW